MDRDFAFGKDNFIWIGVAIVFIIVGFVLMSGGGPPADGISFNPEIFSKQRIVVAPIIVMIGYLLLIYAILKKGGKTAQDNTAKE
jgi:formate-dependent nitrite reductase membrane component NrfD